MRALSGMLRLYQRIREPCRVPEGSEPSLPDTAGSALRRGDHVEARTTARLAGAEVLEERRDRGVVVQLTRLAGAAACLLAALEDAERGLVCLAEQRAAAVTRPGAHVGVDADV